LKAYIYNNKYVLDSADIEKPELTGLGAIVRIIGCGLCGSDIVKLKHNKATEGNVLGHEIVGVIEEINTNTGFKVGNRIVSGHHVPCYKCAYCRNQSYSMCSEFKSSNIIPGGFCEYIYLSEKHLEDSALIIPKNLSDLLASFTEPVACCLRAVRRSCIKEGDSALIIGLGSIGLLMGQVLKSFGASVTGCDLLDERVNLALGLGFDEAYMEIPNDLAESFDKVFLVSGNEKTIPLSLKYVRDGGTINVFASVESDSIGFPNNEIYYRDLTVFGSYSPASLDLRNALTLLKKGLIKVDELVTEYPLDNINQAIEDTVSNKIIKAYIKIGS